MALMIRRGLIPVIVIGFALLNQKTGSIFPTRT